MNSIPQNLARIHERIEAAANRSGRAASEILLVAVSKTHPPDTIRTAWNAGQRVFGENRIQDALPKMPDLPAEMEWHFIGHLQTNKIRKALPHFALFHGIDNSDLARQMNRISGEMGLKTRILLEVNVSGEESKFGYCPETLHREIPELLKWPNLQIEGLMTMAPFSDAPETARPVFAALRNLRDELAKQTGQPLSQLSMGMSGDFEIAIEEGATMVRIGSSLFGAR